MVWEGNEVKWRWFGFPNESHSILQLNPHIASMSAEHEYEFKSKLGEGQDAICVTDE